MSKVKYAIIGFGGIAENRIAKEGFGIDTQRFDGHPQAELVGVCSRSAQRRDTARGMGLKWYESTAEALADSQIEAVFIATNNLSHGPIAKQALQAGKHCLIEKPICASVDEARQLQEIARDRGLSLAVDHMMTENMYNQRARDLIAQGALGAVNDISLHMEFCYGAIPEEASAWRCAKPAELGGPLGDVASHCLYMAEYLLDSEVKSLACVYTPRSLNIEVENGALIHFRLSNDIQGTVRVGFNQPRGDLGSVLTDLGYEVYGAKGLLRACGVLFQLSGHPGEPVALRLEIDDFKQVETIRLDKVQNIYQSVISKHAQSIRAKQPLDGADAIHNLRLVMACHESAQRQAQWITF
jgi:1,5-anhydro-D-fructose reductase (1,5-anhydro-D-mannitol-forming)